MGKRKNHRARYLKPGTPSFFRTGSGTKGGLGRKLTLVSAPAGYGKSTLLSEWVEKSKVPFAWVSLDMRDNDPTRFWSYIIFALEKIPGMQHSLERDEIFNGLRTSSTADDESLLINLIASITANPKRFVRVEVSSQ